MQAERITLLLTNAEKVIYDYKPIHRGNPLAVNVDGFFISITDTFGSIDIYPADKIEVINVTPIRR